MNENDASKLKGNAKNKVLFFDGVCSLCNFWVDFLIRKDRKQHLLFASLQGETAKKLLPAAYLEELHTVVLLDGTRQYVKSEAALRTLCVLGGGWGLLGRVGLWVPRLIRDAVYRLVARYRYRLFGKRSACRLPTPQERALFLD